MFNRVEMDVIHMPLEIHFVPDLMFSKTTLPYRTFPVPLP